MASQNDPHQQPQGQGQTPLKDDGDKKRDGGQDSSTATSTTTTFGGHAGHHEGEGSSQHNPASISVDCATTGTDFFTLDGMQYNIREFDSKENNHSSFNVEDFYHDGVFSCEDLYVVDPSIKVTEVENMSDWHSGSYIPVGTSDSKQLGNGGSTSTASTATTSVTQDNGSGCTATSLGVGGMKIPASGGYPSNGSFYRLVTLTNNLNAATAGAGSMAYSDAGTSSSTTESNGATSVPSGNTAAIENSQSPEVMESPAAGTKARKPRGRKPKHVKEAEAAAAAAVAAGAPPSPAEPANSSPMGTVAQSINLLNRYENQDDMALKTTTHQKATHPSPAAGSQQQATTTLRVPPNSPYFPHPQRQVNNGLGNAVAANMHRTQWSRSQPQMSLEQLASHDRRAILTAMRNQGMSIAEKSQHHHHYPQQQQQRQPSQNIQPPPASETNRAFPHPQYPQHQHRPLYTQQPAHPPLPYNRATQANQHKPSDPLDQLFASRISAPSNRSTVKPNIIQENRRIYNLLTTPSTKSCAPSSLEHLKLSQERWKQYPNPSIFDENLAAPPGVQQAATTPGVSHHHRPTYPLPMPMPSPSRVDPATLIHGGGINIRQGSNFNSAASHSHSQHHEYGSGYHRYTYKIQEMNERLDRLANSNYELRQQAHYLAKVNRHLMNRMRAEIEENHDLRCLMYQHQQSQELNEDGEVVTRGVRERGILPSYVEEELMYDQDTDFGRRRCMQYEDSDGCVQGSDKVLDDLSWLVGKPWAYGRRVPYYRRSSVNGPLDRDVKGEGYFGGERKRKVDTSVSSPQYDGLRKRIRPDTLEMSAAASNGEGKLGEMEKDLGDDGKNSRNLKGGSSPTAASQQIAEEIVRSKQELSSPTRTNSTDRGSLSSVKSVATELATPTLTDDSENTSSTVFNSPLKPGNFNQSTGPYFQACDF